MPPVAAGEIWDAVKNPLAVGFSIAISKAVFSPGAAFGKRWAGFVPSGRTGRSRGQTALLLLVRAAELRASLHLYTPFAETTGACGEVCGVPSQVWVLVELGGTIRWRVPMFPGCSWVQPCVTWLKPSKVCCFGGEF